MRCQWVHIKRLVERQVRFRGHQRLATQDRASKLTSSELKVEVRAAKHLEPQALQQILTPLVSAVESVLSEYPGFVYCRKQ